MRHNKIFTLYIIQHEKFIFQFPFQISCQAFYCFHKWENSMERQVNFHDFQHALKIAYQVLKSQVKFQYFSPPTANNLTRMTNEIITTKLNK